MTEYFHLSRCDAIGSVMESGLRTGMTPALTSDALWVLEWYEINPVFLSERDSRFLSEMTQDGPFEHAVVYEADVTGFKLVADLASLIDAGGKYDPEYGVISWRPNRVPEALKPFADEFGGVEIEHLLDPDTDVCRAAVALTGTAACLEQIPARRLTFHGGFEDFKQVGMTP